MGIRKQNANGISAETFGKINRMTEKEMFGGIDRESDNTIKS